MAFRGVRHNDNVPFEVAFAHVPVDVADGNGVAPVDNVLDDGSAIGDEFCAITFDDIRDGVVAARTNKLYSLDNISYLYWLTENQPTNLTVYGRQALEALAQYDGETQKRHRARILPDFLELMRNAVDSPILDLNILTPSSYMRYVITLTNPRVANTYLSRSAYGNRRAALNHIIRWHNKKGMTKDFQDELGRLFKGFYRRLAQHRRPGRRVLGNNININDNNIDNNNNNNANDGANTIRTGATVAWNTEEGKEPMSVEFLKAVSGCLLHYNTLDGVWAHFFYCLLGI